MVEFSRTFSMSAFECVRQIRLKRQEGPEKLVGQIVEIIKAVDADGSTYDFEAALELDGVLPLSCPLDNPLAFYRDCIEINIRNRKPIWARTIILGRKFVQQLERDERQCFTAAGLLDDPPSDTTVAWWDFTSSSARMIAD